MRERGTGGLIKVKGCRYYYAVIYRDGQQIRISTKTSDKKKAEDFLAEELRKVRTGEQLAKDLNQLHYSDLRAGLLYDYRRKGNKSLQVLDDGSETISSGALKALDDFFGYQAETGDKKEDPGVTVAQITTRKIKDFIAKRSADGAANDTINGSLALLRRMLRIARDDDEILTRIPKVNLLKHGDPREGFVTVERFTKILEHLPDNLHPLLIMLYTTGIRLGEAKQILWEQVDLNEREIRLPGTQTKNKSGRVLPIGRALFPLLQQVAPADRVGEVFDATNLRKAWHKACVAAGEGTLTKVEGKADPVYNGLIIHDLRRSAIRNLIRGGNAEGIVMAISGHKTRAVFDRYNIVDADDVKTALKKAEAKNLVPLVVNSVKVLPAEVRK